MQRRSYRIRKKQSFDNRAASASCAVAAWREDPMADVHLQIGHSHWFDGDRPFFKARL